MDLLSFLMSTGGVQALSGPMGQWCQRVSRHVDEARAQLLLSAPSSFITQDAWYVDSAAGDDRADGSAGLPLRSFAGLGQRWAGSVFDPSIVHVSVHLSGTFTERCVLRGTFPSGYSIVTIQGETTELARGTIVAYTAQNPAAGTRARIAADVDLSPYATKRLRTTSGAQSGAVAFISSIDGSAANVPQPFRLSTTPGSEGVPATSNPSSGDAFVVEECNTRMAGYMFDLQGGIVVLRDVEVDASLVNPGASTRCGMTGAHLYSPTSTAFGCNFRLGTRNAILTGAQSLAACRNEGSTALLLFSGGMQRAIGQCAHGPVAIGDGGYHRGDSCLHEGPNSFLLVDAGGTLEDVSRAFFGVQGGFAGACYLVSSLGRVFYLHDTDYIWGSGNTAPVGIKVEGGGILRYGAVPTLSGPAQQLSIGGAAKTYADLPYIDIGAGTNNTAAMVVRRA